MIGAGASVGAGATVRGSVVADDAQIAAGATVIDSVIGAGASIAEGAVVRESVIGDKASIGARNELTAGAWVWPGIDLPECAVRFSSDG